MHSLLLPLFQRFKLLAVIFLTVLLILSRVVSPTSAFAHWGVCFDDPKVWLDNGTKFDMNTSVHANSSALAHLAFTLHVPPGTQPTRVVRTAGVSSSFEEVTVVADATNGPWADLLATSADGASYQVALTIHEVDASSTWSTATGFTDQHVLACMSNCTGN